MKKTLSFTTANILFGALLILLTPAQLQAQAVNETTALDLLAPESVLNISSELDQSAATLLKIADQFDQINFDNSKVTDVELESLFVMWEQAQELQRNLLRQVGNIDTYVYPDSWQSDLRYVITDLVTDYRSYSIPYPIYEDEDLYQPDYSYIGEYFRSDAAILRLLAGLVNQTDTIADLDQVDLLELLLTKLEVELNDGAMDYQIIEPYTNLLSSTIYSLAYEYKFDDHDCYYLESDRDYNRCYDQTFYAKYLYPFQDAMYEKDDRKVVAIFNRLSPAVKDILAEGSQPIKEFPQIDFELIDETIEIQDEFFRGPNSGLMQSVK